jgi:hypothetical protein
MDIRPALQIQTVIKTLTDVVLPAVDPSNKLAIEQARLAIGTLNIVLQRQALMYRYDRDELARALALADNLQEQAKDLPAAAHALHALANSAEVGADVLDRAKTDPAELEATNVDLRDKLGALITALYTGQDTTKLKHITHSITAHAKEQILRERIWLLGQGWEPDPKSLPPLETLI